MTISTLQSLLPEIILVVTALAVLGVDLTTRRRAQDANARLDAIHRRIDTEAPLIRRHGLEREDICPGLRCKDGVEPRVGPDINNALRALEGLGPSRPRR